MGNQKHIILSSSSNVCITKSSNMKSALQDCCKLFFISCSLYYSKNILEFQIWVKTQKVDPRVFSSAVSSTSNSPFQTQQLRAQILQANRPGVWFQLVIDGLCGLFKLVSCAKPPSPHVSTEDNTVCFRSPTSDTAAQAVTVWVQLLALKWGRIIISPFCFERIFSVFLRNQL